MSNVRPDRRALRGHPFSIKSALAVRGGDCPDCMVWVEESEPIYLRGVSFIERGGGDSRAKPRKVDLSSAEWVCGACLAESGVPA